MNRLKKVFIAVILTLLLLSGSSLYMDKESVYVQGVDKEYVYVQGVDNGYVYVQGVTGKLYETGIRVTEDNQLLEHYVFKDIAIGVAVWASNITIRWCVFINCSDEGIVFFSTSQFNKVENCLFVYCCDGIELQQSHNTTISNCTFNHSWHAGIDIIGKPSHNASIISCNFADNEMDIYRRAVDN